MLDIARRGIARAGRRLGAVALGSLLMLTAATVSATAQIIPTPNPGRDCQPVRTCNFSRTGAVRGCLSSYTCRVCRMVRSRCTIGNARICERVVCSWGG